MQKKKKIELFVTRVMRDSVFETSLLQLYVSVRNGLSHSQVMVLKVCWKEAEGGSWAERKALMSLRAQVADNIWSWA